MPGIADADVDENIYPEIRRAEAAFVARELALVLDDQGVWGASRVVPSPDYISDVVVSGSIEQSDGESLVLNIEARDARGRVWLDKAYSGSTSRYASARPPCCCWRSASPSSARTGGRSACK